VIITCLQVQVLPLISTKKTAHKITETVTCKDIEVVQIKTSVSDKQKDVLTADFEMKIHRQEESFLAFFLRRKIKICFCLQISINLCIFAEN
jgi:hypothetical protein